MIVPLEKGTDSASAVARSRLLQHESRPLLLCDWDDVVFLHFEVPVSVLAGLVPFELDLYDGRAYVSLVAFTLRNLRSAWGGQFTCWMTRPIACHSFLNVRTYVRVNGEAGIYFLAEWLSSSLAVLLGPRLYGLPYRFGRLEYDHRADGNVQGYVGAQRELRFHAKADPNVPLTPTVPDSLEEFLLERYTAFTHRMGRRRLFRIWHALWHTRRASVHIEDDSLLSATGDWYPQAKFVSAACSPGLKNIWLGRPRLLTREQIWEEERRGRDSNPR